MPFWSLHSLQVQKVAGGLSFNRLFLIADYRRKLVHFDQFLHRDDVLR
jgi:hypothetical protein